MNRVVDGEAEYLALSFLDQAAGPVGCGQLADFMRQQGHAISEATVGRLLRDLDQRELTARAGFRGRSLTPQGTARLEDLRRRRTLEAYSTELVEALHATRLDELVDVLVARRALERETARLAAQRIATTQLSELAELVAQYEAAAEPGRLAQVDMAFHRKLAEAAGNRVLQAATRLVHEEAETVPMPPGVSLALRRHLASDHGRIMQAIAAGDPGRAELAMVRHIDEIIRVVTEHSERRTGA